MATVYLAEDLRHHRLVAVKVLRPELTGDPSEGQRFLQEIEIEAGLAHPHIVPLFDSGRIGETVFFVMPYIDGQTLRERLDREGILPVEDALTIIDQLATALDYAHARGIVHRDVKPSNVLLGEGGAVLADFGVALGLEKAGASELAKLRLSAGTPDYLSPEQATGAGPVDHRSDLYSLGCVAYEMFAGEVPFPGSSIQAVLTRHLGAPPPDVRLVRPSLPPGVCTALQRSLAKEPADRFQTADELAEALREAVEREGGAAVGAPWWPGAEPPRSRPGRAGVALAGLLAIGLAGAFVVARSGSPARGEPLVPHQVTFEGDIRQAYGSPDGALLAYEVVREGTYRLLVAEGDGSSPVEIYRTDGFACCPSWSPDGTRILVREGERREGRGLVFPRRGGDPQPLPTDVATAWSPDGGRIVSWWPAADTLRFVDAVTGDVAGSLRLDVPHRWINGIDWSPGGRLLSVATTDSGGSDALWTVPVDGGQPREVFRASVSIASPHWAASGDAIYFLLAGQNVSKVAVDDNGAAVGGPVSLAAGLSPHVYNPTIPSFTVSTDGTRLHYARWQGKANLLQVDLSSTETLADETRWLTSGTAERKEPRISPDARRLAFVGQGAAGWDIRVHDFEGGTRRITYFDGMVVSPSWAPDGRRLVFGGIRGMDRGVWIVSAEGGSARRVGGDRYGGYEVVWLADGTILYERGGDREYGLLSVDRGDVGSIEAPERAWLYGPRGSPDGRRIAFRVTGESAGLWVFDLDEGSWTRISERAVGPVAWAPSGDTVYAMPVDGRVGATSGEILAVPSDGGESRVVARLPVGTLVNPWNASFHPPRGIFVGAVNEASVDAWILEGFDPGG